MFLNEGEEVIRVEIVNQKNTLIDGFTYETKEKGEMAYALLVQCYGLAKRVGAFNAPRKVQLVRHWTEHKNGMLTSKRDILLEYKFGE